MPASDHPDGESSGALEAGLHPRFTCRFCGQPHRTVALSPRRKALCARCGLTLAKGSRFGKHASPALLTTALLLAVPAMTLPFITVGKLGNERVGHLFSGASTLWSEGMPLLGLWVALCAGLLPAGLLALLAGAALQTRFGNPGTDTPHTVRIAAALAPWAMPEVHLLAVLVALTKLGSLVDVKVGPGFWCYSAMSVLVLLCWRNFRLGPPLQGDARR